MEAAPCESQFLNRFLSLPIVTSALEKSTSAYQRSKQSYPIVGKTLSVAEGSITFVYNKSKLLLTKMEGKARAVGVNKVLSVADDLAVKVLQRVEAKLPIITQPTDEVLQVIFDYTNNVKARITVVVSPVTRRVRAVTVTLIDKLRPIYEFVMRPIRPVYIWTKSQLEAFAMKVLQLIWYHPMTCVRFYVSDFQARRQRIRDIRNYQLEHADEPEDNVEAPPTLESLDEGFAFGLHLIYANIANRVLTWESEINPIIRLVIHVLYPELANLPVPLAPAPEQAVAALEPLRFRFANPSN